MSNLDRLTPSYGQRMAKPIKIGKDYNLERFDPQLVEWAIRRYNNHKDKPGSRFWLSPPWLGHYIGLHGERGLGDLMQWKWVPRLDGPDPGWDFKELLRFDKGGLYYIDAKAFDEAVPERARTVLLRADGDMKKRIGERKIYVWCGYHGKFDMAWPQGWLHGHEIDLNGPRQDNHSLIIDRKSLHPMAKLARATWTSLH